MRRWFKHWRDKSAARRANTVEVQSIFGPMTAFAGDFATRQIEQYGAHTRNEVALLCSLVRPGDLIYDVGAHIGTFAIPLALAAGDNGHVIAIEADAESFALLRRNLDRLGLGGRVTPHRGIAGGRDLRYRRVCVDRHTSATHFLPDPGGAPIPTIALDDLADRAQPSRRVAVIKIDVEGMELAVLRSSVRTIARDRPVLYVEISMAQLARYDATLPAVAEFLGPYDYRCFRNIGDRNSSLDAFELMELGDLHEGGEFYDLVAVPADRAATFPALASLPKRLHMIARRIRDTAGRGS
jgi:FkbM family methyltransferase